MTELEWTATDPNSALPVFSSISASFHVSVSGFHASTFTQLLLQSKERAQPLQGNCRSGQSPQRQGADLQQKPLRAQIEALTCRLLL